MRDAVLPAQSQTTQQRLAARPFSRLLTGVLAVCDQAIFALTNLLLQIVLVRSVIPQEFGAYSVASTFLFLTAMIHQTCFIEPMFVLGGSRFSDCLRGYHMMLRGWGSLYFGLSVSVCGAVLAAAAAVAGSSIAAPLMAFALTSPFVLYLWLMRRAAFAVGRVDLAAAGGAAYAVLLLGPVIFLDMIGFLSAVNAILLTGVASSLAAVLLHFRLALPQGASVAPSDIAQAHLRYGRWALSAEAVNWALVNSPIMLLPIWYGLAQSAELRVLSLLYMPMLQIAAVASLLMLRSFSRETRVVGWAQVAAISGALAGFATTYTIVILVIGASTLALATNDVYRLSSGTLALAGLGYALLVAAQAPIAALRAKGKARLVFSANLIGLLVFAALAPMALPHGIEGMLAAQAAAWTTSLIMAVVLYTRCLPMTSGY